jgi:hypothetical protein
MSYCPNCGQPFAPEAKFCGNCGGATTNPAANTPQVVGGQPGPRCRICGVGTLRLEKRYRMSAPVVVIGYILLVPSVLGMFFSVLTMFSVAGHSSTNNEVSAVAGGLVFFLAVAFFVSGLFGWILVMKKKVLCCEHCSAVVPAS